MKHSEPQWTHMDASGQVRMVDVSDKGVTVREARAETTVRVSRKTMESILDRSVPKGNVLEAARIAGIMAGKKTWEWIPLCHPIQITGIDIEFDLKEELNEIHISSRVRSLDRTGVEMEAMVAVTAAALTVYDMCKAIDRAMSIDHIRLTYKSGGRSGTYERG
ncbi:MAG: cyclic pyranopterin monophosphate synthase MoaC [Deltaproteobacteria bacterium]|nr:cyclic pyranopterin monophosphate synthase MoaC [Deltaproteobacteria bacterium]